MEVARAKRSAAWMVPGQRMAITYLRPKNLGMVRAFQGDCIATHRRHLGSAIDTIDFDSVEDHGLLRVKVARVWP